MVRLSGLHPQEAKNLMSWPRVHIEPGDWITPKPLAESTISPDHDGRPAPPTRSAVRRGRCRLPDHPRRRRLR